MKRMMLFASLCVVGFVLAPIASASATEATGACTLSGTAKFEPPLSQIPTKGDEYSFESESGSCTSVPAAEFIKAKVAGKGTLSCALSSGLGVELIGEAEGEGELELKIAGKVEKHKFKLKFVAAAGLVPLVLTGEVTGAGLATFLLDPESAQKCTIAGPAKTLKFTAVAAGKI